MKKLLLLSLMAGMTCPCIAQQVPLRETTPKPAGVQYFNSVQLPDGDVLVFGGSADFPNVVSSSWRYDWQTETWSEAAELAFPVAQMAVTLLSNGDILCAGGTKDFSGKVQKSQRFVVSAGEWMESTGDFEVFNPIYTGHSLVTLPNDYVLITTTNGNLAIYAPEADTWTEIDPGPLDAGGGPMVWLEAQAEVFFPGAGGQVYTPNDPPFTGDLFYLDPPQPLFSSGVVKLADGRVLSMDLDFNFDNHVSIYDPVTRTAAIVSEVPYNGGSNSRSAILMPDGKVLTFGFGDITSPGDTKLVEVYNPATNEWEVGTYDDLGPFSTPQLHLLPDGSVFAISTQPENIDQKMKNRCWIINRDESTAAMEELSSTIRLFPNPATDWLQLEGLDGVRANLDLYRPDGTLAASWKTVNGGIVLSAKKLEAGIYFYRLSVGKEERWQSGRIVVK